MGSRRLGRKRLFSLEKQGQSLTASDIGMGAGMSPALVRAHQSREGLIITTEIVLDLGTSKADISCYGNNDAIGVQGASSTIFTWSLATFGRLLEIEIVCFETPNGDEAIADDLELHQHNSEINADATLKTVGTVVLAGDGAYAIGDAARIAVTSLSSLGQDYSVHKYFAFAQGEASHDGAEEVYTAGKFVIRVTGQADPTNSDI